MYLRLIASQSGSIAILWHIKAYDANGNVVPMDVRNIVDHNMNSRVDNLHRLFIDGENGVPYYTGSEKGYYVFYLPKEVRRVTLRNWDNTTYGKEYQIQEARENIEEQFKTTYIVKDNSNGAKNMYDITYISNYFLIKQNDSYYSIKNNFYELGQPKDNAQLEQWYGKYGTKNVNTILEPLDFKDVPMSLEESTGIWKTDFELDANKILGNIKMIEESIKNEGNKTIRYECEQYKIYDKLDNEFEIMMADNK
ncbi:cell adhesion domain-containing protein [Clostridium tetani]|uniref:hypothetical protein n=1 Tax=Clostridium tetani TaxID=1513 RepID=UPI000E129DD3|nr:hypothetical protein [Clostridium tetani]RXI75185.1 hypothetical protein DP128_11530 [Clostridium tetani]WFN62946.1 hypothetical protein PAA20_05715 [Clostridium tetani]SUY55153.1 cell adhesion domain-containing protein [Clostridium tetani]BDR64029.1 hypothetical protein K134307016_09630 [Clostridium tetani]BDR78024.1 hypothetical protein K154307017_09570 [Clostridium tetani]